MEQIDISGDGGVLKKILRAGTSAPPKSESTVNVHYVGTLLDGTKFDSSRDRDSPFSFKLGCNQVIKGWDLGVATMQKGELAVLTCRSDYAYGKAGSGDKIPPDATLQFEVELLSWSHDSDVFGDEKVVKTLITSSEDWKTPESGEYARLRYVVKSKDGQVLDNSHENETLEITISDADTGCLSACLKKMKSREVSVFSVAPPYVIGHGIEYPKDEPVDIEINLLLHGKFEDLSKDGRLMKKTLVGGDGWEMPTNGAQVRYHMKVKNAQGQLLYDSRSAGSPLTATAGSGDFAEAFDFILVNMKKDEVSEYTVDASLGFNEHFPPPPNVPVGENLILEIELTEIGKGVESWNVKIDQKIAQANEKKAKGNEFFGQGNVSRAFRYYEQVVKLFKDKAGNAEADRIEVSEGNKLKLPCLLNMAACDLKCKRWTDAVTHCEKALKIESKNIKGLYRLAQAYVELTEYYNAKLKLDEILLMEPANGDAQKLMSRLQKLQSEQDKKDKKTFAAMFKAL